MDVLASMRLLTAQAGVSSCTANVYDSLSAADRNPSAQSLGFSFAGGGAVGKFFLSVILFSIAAILFIAYGAQAMEPAELKQVRAEYAIERALADQAAERAKREVMEAAGMNLAHGVATASAMTGALINLLIGVAGVALISAGVGAARWALKPELIPFKEGMAAIVARNTAPWWRRLWGYVEMTYFNPNQQAAPVVKIINERDGGLRTVTDTFGLTTDQLLEAHRGGQDVQKVQAGWRPKLPTKSKWEIIQSAGLLEQALPQRREPSTQLMLPKEIQPRLTLSDAIVGSNLKDGIILGQDAETNEPCRWPISRIVHGGILGSSQQGKTSTAATTAALELIALGCHVLIFDPEVEGYWSIFRRHAEVVETSGELLAHHLDCLNREYERRGESMHAQNVNHYNRLTDPPPRVMVLIEEFSDLLADSANNSPDHGRVLAVLERLVRRGAKRGIHLLILDQHNKKWPGPMQENINMRLTFRQGRKDYSLVSYNDIDTLPKGHFAHNGRVYEAFWAEAEVMARLAELPRFAYAPIVRERVNAPTDTPTQAAPTGAGANAGSPNVTPVEGRSTSILPAFLLALLNGSGKVTNAAADSNEWDDLAALLFARRPQTTQADLCRMMAEADPLGRPYTAFRGSLSMDLYHCYSPHGDSKKIQTAKRRTIAKTRSN
jgi:hypothetical protein